MSTSDISKHFYSSADMTKPLGERYRVLGFVKLYTPEWETAPTFSEGFRSVSGPASLISSLIPGNYSQKIWSD
jgi:hypothetical protein